MSTPRVLVLCTGNSCRSQMAEGLMRAAAARRGVMLEVHSAGTRPSFVNPRAVAAMRDIGIDISGHASKSALLFAGQRFDHVITVCDQAAEVCPVFPGNARRTHWPTDDPADAAGSPEEIRATFARVRDGLAQRIEAWFDETFKR